MIPKNKNKEKMKTKVSLWLDDEVLELVDKVAGSYSLSRSDYIRLTLREALVNRGLLPREIGAPLPAKGEVS